MHLGHYRMTTFWWVVGIVVAIRVLALPLAVAVGRAFAQGWEDEGG